MNQVIVNLSSLYSTLRMGTLTLGSVTNPHVIAEDDQATTKLLQNTVCLTFSGLVQSLGLSSLIITLYPCGYSIT